MQIAAIFSIKIHFPTHHHTLDACGWFIFFAAIPLIVDIFDVMRRRTIVYFMFIIATAMEEDYYQSLIYDK